MFHRMNSIPAATQTCHSSLSTQDIASIEGPTTPPLHYPPTNLAPSLSHPSHEHEVDRYISIRLSSLHHARHALATLLFNEAMTDSDGLRSDIANASFVRASDLFHLRCHLKKEACLYRYGTDTRTELEQQIGSLEREICGIVEARNSDPDLTRRVCSNRAINVTHAKQVLASIETIQLLFSVEGIGLRVGGIVGRAMLMIEALLSELPNARVHIHSPEKSFSAAGVVFGSAAAGRLTMGQFPLEGPGVHGSHEAHMHVDVTGSWPSAKRDGVAAHTTLYPFAYVQELGSIRWLGAPEMPELTLALHQSPVCNDLHNPRGTVILDRGLYKARQERDRWDLARLTHERQAWRSAVIAHPANSKLEELASHEGWSVDEAIWSTCYVWDTNKLTKELLTLSNFIRDNPHALPSSESSTLPHILIHARPTGWGDFEYMCARLAEAGIRIIDTTARVVQHLPHGPSPRITLITHSAIDNVYMRQAVSQLVGCPVRDATNSHWIDFPVYVTGSASWLESLSAGGIALHDDTDTLSGNKLGQIASLLLKQEILAGKDLGGLSWSAAHLSAMWAATSHILGSDSAAYRYRDLERLSAESRAFTDSLYQLNSVDDLIIALGDIVIRKSLGTRP